MIEYSNDMENVIKIVEKHLKTKDPFAYEAIECLLKVFNDKSAFMVWEHYKNYYNIQLSDDEKKKEMD